jgi:hypothetical protein
VEQGMLAELLRALPVAVLVGAVPGYFWARSLSPVGDRVEMLAYSTALSATLVPTAALLQTRLFATGVTLPIAAASAGAVFATGLVAYLWLGPAGHADKPPLARLPAPLGVYGILPLLAAFVLVLAVAFGLVSGDRYAVATALLMSLAGVLGTLTSRGPARRPRGTPVGPGPSPVWGALLAAVALVVLLRGYWGPVRHDWPFIRGGDQYSHAVMAQLMMSEGSIDSYLIYPPGFHAMTAVISRLSGLEPLEVFPVVAPLLLLLPALALYALANRLWGFWCGVAAAFFSVLLGGTYYYYNDAMYPNLVTSQFLMVMAVAVLIVTYASPPSVRGALLLAVLGSSVVLYHPVGSMYLAVVLAFVGLLLVPYLLLRERPRGVALFLSLALLGLLSVVYAWDTYDLGGTLSGLSGGSGASSTGAAINMAVGTQIPYTLDFLLGNMVSQPVAWLGLLGVFLVLGELLWRRTNRPQALAYLTLVFWALLLFAGSRTPLTGFPQRFGRDLCVPLAVFAALAFLGVLQSLSGSRKQAAVVFVASLAVLTASTLVGVRTASSLQSASGPSVQMTITPEISAAGEWLREHNSGGNIMVSPHINQVPSRMMLAMGGYSALQSFEPIQIVYPRDLPPSGPEPLRDVLWVVMHPGGERTAALLEKHDVRYVVLYKDMPDRFTRDYWRLFEARPDLYKAVFENEDVLIVARRGAAPAG